MTKAVELMKKNLTHHEEAGPRALPHLMPCVCLVHARDNITRRRWSE